MNDEKCLLQSVCSGDGDAWSKFVAAYEKRVRGYVKKLLPRKDAIVDEIVQEAFLGFFIALPTFDIECSPAAMLLAIARFKAYDYMDRIKQETNMDSLDVRRYVKNRTVLDKIIEDEDRRSLMSKVMYVVTAKISAIKNDTDRRMIQLAVLDGKKNRDIAKICGCRPAVVANKKNRFLDSVRAFVLEGMQND